MRILNSTIAMGLGTLASSLVAVSPASAAGLPQLDASTYSAQVVWLVITFVILYVLMAKMALPRIGEVLEERQNKIDDNLTKAEELKAQADTAAQAYETSLSTARTKAQGAIRDVKEKAAGEAAARQSALHDKLKTQIAESEKAIASARDEALAGIKDVATDVASSVIEKLVGEAPDGKSVSGAIQAALKSRA
ncbi:MAG: F0F1 ATP synthase subunit B' [Rhodospirillales bacterium]|nr:F0F1 ATP synthase subunit B' [Rhodospirillales bacterium]